MPKWPRFYMDKDQAQSCVNALKGKELVDQELLETARNPRYSDEFVGNLLRSRIK